jgi:NAD(P)-dependent dehydrogenase (short-subunit alcohol dehydrogenase family)
MTATFDVRDADAVRSGVADAIAALGGCDAVIANAGVVDTIHRAERFADGEWRKDLETNLYGAFYLAQAAFGALEASGDGRVVVISSVGAESGIPGQVAYGASKAGLVGMIRTLAAEWASRGIRCNAVMPGFIATPKVRAMPDQVRRAVTAQIPLGRFGATEELAGAVSFLLSPAAAYITGAVLRVDGGFGLATR